MGQERAQFSACPPAADPNGGEFWHPPAVTVRTGARANGQLNVVQEAGGNWPNFDVFVDVPNTWQNVILLARIKVEGGAFDLRSVRVRELDRLTYSAGDELVGISDEPGQPGRIRGVMQVRGRPPFGAFEVAAFHPDGTAVDDGRFWIHGFGTQGDMVGDMSGRLEIDPYTSRGQQVSFTSAVDDEGGIPAASTQTIFTRAVSDNRAVHLTDVSITGTNLAALTDVTLRLRNPTTAATLNRAKWTVGGGKVVDMHRARPLIGARGFEWQVVVGAGNPVHLNVEGFIAS